MRGFLSWLEHVPPHSVKQPLLMPATVEILQMSAEVGGVELKLTADSTHAGVVNVSGAFD